MATNFPGFSRLGGDTYDYTRSGSKKSESAPELLFKMCKKIAQLTKVVYVLNTRNDDLEMQCKSADEATEEKVSSATADLKRTVSQLKAELKKKIDLNDRVKGLEETLILRDQELRKLLEEIATVRKRQEERERDLSCAYRLELRQATEAQQVAERRLAEVLAGQEDSQRLPTNRRRSTEYQGTLLHKEKSVEHEAKEEKRLSLDEEESEEEPERRKRGVADETRRRVREQEVAEFRRLVEQLQKDLKEKTERWEAVAKEERSKLEAQLERAKTAKEDAEKLLAQQLQAESRNLVSQETRYQEKLSELSSQLAARESEANRLHLVIEDLKRELVAKASGMDRLQAELDASNKEGEYVKQTLRRLENDVTGFRHKNTELADELQKKADEIEALKEEKTKLEVEKKAMEENSEEEERMEVVEELKRKLKELEESVAEAANERDRVGREKRRLEAEREEEMKIVQEALDEAIEEKASIQARFERDFERLRTVNTDREQKLLDDFEWKLREVEAKCKRKLEERERATEEKLKAVRQETDVAKQELAALKTHEAELVQLRGLSHEQQRSIRMGARQIESLQVSEKILQEEASNLRELLEQEKARQNAMQGIHDKKLAEMERSWKNRLEALRNELNFSSDVRLKKEKVQLKTELEALHLAEKKKLKEETSAKMICERRELERKLKAATDEVVQLKTTIENKEAIWRRELEKTRANSDRDILDLRRKLDKLDMSYQDQIENMTSKHQRELETLNEEAEQRLAAAEQNWQMQLSSTRTTLELVKEQMERDAQKRVEALQNEYQNKLEYQWKRLNEEKEIAILTVERKFIQQLEILKEEMENSSKISTAQESEHHHEKIELLKKELISHTKVIDDLEGNVDVLQGEMQVSNEELNDQSGEMKKYQSETEKTMREKELQMEALQLRELEMVRNSGSQEALKAEFQALRDAFQREPSSHSEISEEWRSKSEAQGPRPEDERSTADLRHSLEESDISALTEEKRFERPEPSNRPTVPVRRRGCEVASPRDGREKDFPERDRSTGSVGTPRRDSRNSSPGPSVGGPTKGETSCGRKPCDRLRPTAASPAAAAADPSSNRIRSRSLDFGLPFDSLSTAPILHSARPAHRSYLRELHSPSTSAPVLSIRTSSSLPTLSSLEDNGSENVSSSFNGREHLDPVPRDPTPPQ